MAHLLRDLPNRSGKLTKITPGTRIIHEPTRYRISAVDVTDKSSSIPVVQNASNLTLRTFSRKTTTRSGPQIFENSSDGGSCQNTGMSGSAGSTSSASVSSIVDVNGAPHTANSRDRDSSMEELSTLHGQSNTKKTFGARGNLTISFGSNNNRKGNEIPSSGRPSSTSAGEQQRPSIAVGQGRPSIPAGLNSNRGLGTSRLNQSVLKNTNDTNNNRKRIVDLSGSGSGASTSAGASAGTASCRATALQPMQLKRLKR